MRVFRERTPLIRSMTGFARARRHGNWGELTLELRALNHRFLDLRLVLPEPLRALEVAIRECLRTRLTRGRIEAALRWRPPPGEGFVIDRELALEVGSQARRLAQAVQGAEVAGLDPLRLLAWPGVVEAPHLELEALTPEVVAVTEDAVRGLVDARIREGGALADALAERLERLLAGIEPARALAQAAKATLQARLTARLEALGAEVDPVRVAQEAALLVVRQDTSEELDRLEAHAREALRLLGSDESVGRRLDFLIQELGREANTLASKAGDMECSRQALEFKVLIEEMREQAQNVE